MSSTGYGCSLVVESCRTGDRPGAPTELGRGGEPFGRRTTVDSKIAPNRTEGRSADDSMED